MPPKASTRGTGRGRGRGRGGASAARAPTADADGDVDMKTPAVAESDVSATIESQPGEPAGRAPVQRLESLNATEAASRTASPATRRSASTRGKKPAAIKPTFKGRRTKAEREELEKLVSQREKERQKERDAEEKGKWKAKVRPKQEYPNKYVGATSGPFSLGSVAKGKCFELVI